MGDEPVSPCAAFIAPGFFNRSLYLKHTCTVYGMTRGHLELMKIPTCNCRPLAVRCSSSAREQLLCRQLATSGSDPGSRRVNPLGIQMLSKPIYEQVFHQSSHGRSKQLNSALEQSVQHLKAQNLWGKECSTMLDLDIKLPQLLGKNLDEHFRTIAKTQSQPYLDLAMQLVHAKLHPMPAEWSSKPGWTRYDPVSGCGKGVEYPADDALVLDVETCVIEGQRPILAVAVSPNAWYSWTSPRMASSRDFIDNMERDTNLEDLIPMEPSTKGVKAAEDSWERPKVVVGHHVSYDRARLKEQYFMKVRILGGKLFYCKITVLGTEDEVHRHTESARVCCWTDFSPEGDLAIQETEALGEE